MRHEIAEIPCRFVGDFKVGDNLAYNCKALCDLVHANRNGSLNKIVVIQTCSILEAALSQIIYRAQYFRREGVPNIPIEYINEIRGKQIDKFAVVVDILRKYRVLDKLGGESYENLHKLRRYRNKVHIQEDLSRFAAVPGFRAYRDEAAVFDDRLVHWALDLNLAVLSYLSETFPRPSHVCAYLAPLRVPVWHGSVLARATHSQVARIEG